MSLFEPGSAVEENIGKGWNVFFKQVASLSIFTMRFFREFWKPPYEFGELAKQFYLVGNRSLSLVGITAFIMGIVLTVQSRPTLAEFGAISWLPGMVAISIIKEIGPVITALICAGKVGSSFGAELGSMKVTEQIDAMEVSGANPFKYLVVTRVLATTLMIPLLVIFADFIALAGSYVAVNFTEHMSVPLFISLGLDNVDFLTIMPAFVKTIFFGMAIGIVGTYEGYNSGLGTEGVGKAANSAVVTGSLLIFVIDMIAVQIASFF